LFFISHSFSANNALFTVCATSVPIGGIIHNVLTDNDWLAYLIRSTSGPDTGPNHTGKHGDEYLR
jgi:hypothetical protein